MSRYIQLSSSEIVLEETSSIADEFTSSDIVEDEAALFSAEPVPQTYSGSKYYTPIYGSENFYTPWGTSSLDVGFQYLKDTMGGISTIALLVFALPFAIRAIQSLVEAFKKGMK